MTEEEENEMEINIEAKYAGRTEKEFLNNISYAECLYILDTRNKYCNEIKDLSLLKLVDIISKLQTDIEIKDKVIENLEKENKELRKHILNYQGTTGILLKMEDKDE